MNNLLTGLHILLLKSPESEHPLARGLQQLGADVSFLPSIKITPLAITQALPQALQQQQQALGIFVSQHAVTHCHQYWSTVAKFSQLFAVGPRTAALLKKNAMTKVKIPEMFSSEGLLAMPELQHIANKHVYIFCGANSRQQLKQTLTQRNANVIEVMCYQRELADISTEEILATTTQQFNVIVANSASALTNFYQLFAAELDWLNQQQFLVLSPAMAKLAQQLGNKRACLIANNASAEAIIEQIQLSRHRKIT